MLLQTIEPGTISVSSVEQDPALVLTDPQRFDEFYEHIRREAEAHQPDVTTDRGRKAIASLARRIATTKVAIDQAGKELNEEARAKINIVDQARRTIRERLDALRDQVRAPLTAWEAAEEQREQVVAARFDMLERASVVPHTWKAAMVDDVVRTLRGLEYPPEVYQTRLDAALQMHASVLERLTEAHTRIRGEEADRAELDRLRAEAAERQAADLRAAAEAQARQRADAEAERQRLAAEQAERDRAAQAARAEQERQQAIARAAQEAEDRARAEAERAALVERQRIGAEHRAEVDRLQRQADARAEQDRIASAEVQRQAEADRLRAENQRHRGNVMRRAKEALMQHAGIDEDQAKRVVLAVTGGHVPAMTVAF